MSTQPIDYAALAEQARKAVPVDYAAMAEQVRKGEPGKIPEIDAYLKSPPKTASQSVADFMQEWWNQVNPVEGIKGLAQATNHPLDTGGSMLDAQGQLAYKARDAFKRGDYVEGLRHGLNYLLPIIGPQADRAGDLLDQGEYAKGAGATAGIATNVVAPELVKKVSLPAGVANKATGVAKDLYQSALKPPVTAANAPQMVATGLENRIPVSAAGAEKLNNLVADLNQKITAEIAARPGVTINKFKVASRLGDTAKDMANQVNPSKDLKAVAESGNEFLDTQPGQIPASQAQAIKVGTYKQLEGKYGELGNAATESQKALARGLKEELASAFPELAGLNASEGRLLDLQPALERAVNRNSNNQVIGIGSPVFAGATKAVTGSGGAAAAAALLKSVIDMPAIKSRLAEAIFWGAKKGSNPLTRQAAKARVAAYLNALGNSAENSNQTQTSTAPQQ